MLTGRNDITRGARGQAPDDGRVRQRLHRDDQVGGVEPALVVDARPRRRCTRRRRAGACARARLDDHSARARSACRPGRARAPPWSRPRASRAPPRSSRAQPRGLLRRERAGEVRVSRTAGRLRRYLPAASGTSWSTVSTQAGTRVVAGPVRVSSNRWLPWPGTRFSSSVGTPRARAVRAKPAAGWTSPEVPIETNASAWSRASSTTSSPRGTSPNQTTSGRRLADPQAGQGGSSARAPSQGLVTSQTVHRAARSTPCMCSTRTEPPRSCRSSTFWVTSSRSSPRCCSSRASAWCAALGSTSASAARRAS